MEVREEEHRRGSDHRDATERQEVVGVVGCRDEHEGRVAEALGVRDGESAGGDPTGDGHGAGTEEYFVQALAEGHEEVPERRLARRRRRMVGVALSASRSAVQLRSKGLPSSALGERQLGGGGLFPAVRSAGGGGGAAVAAAAAATAGRGRRLGPDRRERSSDSAGSRPWRHRRRSWPNEREARYLSAARRERHGPHRRRAEQSLARRRRRWRQRRLRADCGGGPRSGSRCGGQRAVSEGTTTQRGGDYRRRRHLLGFRRSGSLPRT
mmetsp:Transcript_24944/g.46163  ORF Transcript_24944/g.46163 Transcript_24944/m.46163 type:complete len:267 (-) Transcript_24944:2725-3525(-)